jgi:hypothetical protein
LSLEESIRILRMEEDVNDDKTFGVIIRAKCAVIGHVFNAKLRVSEESFRQQRFDRLPELLKLIADEEKRLPTKLIEAAVS